MIVRRINPDQATESELHALHRLRRRIVSERSPNDPPMTYEQFLSGFGGVPPMFEVNIWVLADEGSDDFVARATMILAHTEENRHLAQFEITVLPERRREGLGTELLRYGVERAREDGRTTMISPGYATVPASEAFLRRIGGEVALEGHTNRLQLAEVDRALMRGWIERARERASDFEMGFWEGPYPEEHLEEATAMMALYNSQPMGDLEIEDFEYTPERVRALEAMHTARGLTRWTLYVREKSTGALAGFTEIFINRAKPDEIEQGLTGVYPAYRNRGLGRWLKAAMTEKILTEIPEAEVISTSNADENEPMMNINREMGFRPALADTLWQMQIERVEGYLAERTEGVRVG